MMRFRRQVNAIDVHHHRAAPRRPPYFDKGAAKTFEIGELIVPWQANRGGGVRQQLHPTIDDHPLDAGMAMGLDFQLVWLSKLLLHQS